MQIVNTIISLALAILCCIKCHILNVSINISNISEVTFYKTIYHIDILK